MSSEGHQAGAAALVLLGTVACWSAVHKFQDAYTQRLARWETDQWWWRQCTDMQFYEKMQEHMDICDNLHVVAVHTIKWSAAADVVSGSVRALMLAPHEALLSGGLAVVLVCLLHGSARLLGQGGRRARVFDGQTLARHRMPPLV